MADNNASEAAPAKKGKLKLILLIVLVVILAIALSVAGTLWFLGGSLASGDHDEAATGEVEESFVPSTYADIEKALVTTIQSEGRQRYAQAYLSFEARNPDALAAAQPAAT